MTIRNELIDELLAGQDPASVMRQDGLLGELKKALLNRLMAAEFDYHLAQGPGGGGGQEPPQWLHPQAGPDRRQPR
jgi:putative transposase